MLALIAGPAIIPRFSNFAKSSGWEVYRRGLLARPRIYVCALERCKIHSWLALPGSEWQMETNHWVGGGIYHGQRPQRVMASMPKRIDRLIINRHRGWCRLSCYRLRPFQRVTWIRGTNMMMGIPLMVTRNKLMYYS